MARRETSEPDPYADDLDVYAPHEAGHAAPAARTGRPAGSSAATPRGPRSERRLGGLVLAGAASLVLLVVGIATASTAFTKTGGGEIAVVRDGGPFDDNRIRTVVDPASGVQWVGLRSQVHRYPAQQRFYTITSDAGRGERAGVDVERTPTSDGVEVGVEGTIYFSLTRDHAALERFDDRYGTRTFASVGGDEMHAWDGDEGWSAFLDQVVRPVIGNNFRQQIGGFRCVELVSTCALVQNGGATAAPASRLPVPAGSSSNVNISRVQDSLQKALQADLDATLGGAFIVDIRVNLVRLTLPQDVQDAVNRTLAAFARVSEAQAEVQQAKALASANREKQKGYSDCPSCATIDQLKAIPPTVTTFAPGSGFAVTGK